MREVGTLASEEQARTFADYLVGQEIPAEARPGKEGWSVWAHKEDQLARARDELARFRAEPGHGRYKAGVALAREVRAERARADKVFRRLDRDASATWQVPVLSRCPVVLALIVASVVVFIWSHGGERGQVDLILFISKWPLAPAESPFGFLPEVRAGELWRLITPIFLHLSVLHLVFNMSCLSYFGTQVEAKHGSWSLGLFVLLSGIASNLTQYAVEGAYFGGMSGVVYALFGYVWIRSAYERVPGLRVSGQGVLIMLLWLAAGTLGLLESLGMKVANAGHLSGLAFGLAAAALAPHLKRRPAA